MNTLMMFGETAIVSDFVATFIPILRIVLIGIITICAIIIIIATLLQSSANPAGSSAISGGASESYFSQSKDNSRDGKLKRVTIWTAVVLVVCVVLYFTTGIWLGFSAAI
ncbi:MAG: preprotein translocase subunit SecG [Clostridia bacterium]|jgi:protein translocase SecG subunit|nr:preprotein translocase subunit SecG [Clostridia bacterium]MDD3232094.1 preprotein translocase subunit SecG [Clostridia bacterium]MDD3862672.1 preprotein translocase subunit SecG [Clostridia bacterium]MDD4408754.1 preprotein translocase subunit SecG [Clostridia bacterium]